MANSDNDIRSKLVPITVSNVGQHVLSALAPSQDTTSDQLSNFYRPATIPFVRHSPLPPVGQSTVGAVTSGVSQTRSLQVAYGTTRNLNQIPQSQISTGTVTSTSVSQRLLPSTYTLTGSWSNPGNAIDNNQGSYASASSTTSNIVYTASGFAAFGSSFTTDALQVILYVTAVSGGSVLLEYSLDGGNNWSSWQSISSAQSQAQTYSLPLSTTQATQNVQARVTLPGSSTGGSGNQSAYAGTGADGGGARAWSSPGNATGSAGTGAINTFSSSNSSTATNSLNLTNFGFGGLIPAGSTINGIQAVVTCHGNEKTMGTNILTVQENSVTLLNVGGTADKSMGRNYPTGKSTFTYGGSSDLWSAPSATYANVTNAAFGISIQAYLANDGTYTGAMAIVYGVQITVYYTTAAGSSSATARIYDISQNVTVG